MSDDFNEWDEESSNKTDRVFGWMILVFSAIGIALGFGWLCGLFA